MTITRDVLAAQLRDYLQHHISRAALVDWAERAMMDDEFDDRDLETIRDITTRLGLADVGVRPDVGGCDGYLSRLGYRANVDVVQAG